MRSIIKIVLVSFLLFGCGPKLKVYSIHDLMKSRKIRNDDYYLKDKSRSYELLKGKWIWTNQADTLVVNIIPVYKKKYYNNKFGGKKNAYHDTAILELKFIESGSTIVDEFGSVKADSCLYASPLGIYTNMFYLYNRCRTGIYDHPILINIGGHLVLVNKWNGDEGALIEKEGEYKIVIPRTITLKRME